jgi:hypothetical protein
MGILKDLGRFVEDEMEDRLDDEKISSRRDDDEDFSSKRDDDEDDFEEEEEEEEDGSAADILNHIESLQDIVKDIDKYTTDQGSTTAFEVEVSLRKSIQKMNDLADELYKKKNKEVKKI